jgi:23S rRNA G2445 N2-methylase RlmL
MTTTMGCSQHTLLQRQHQRLMMVNNKLILIFPIRKPRSSSSSTTSSSTTRSSSGFVVAIRESEHLSRDQLCRRCDSKSIRWKGPSLSAGSAACTTTYRTCKKYYCHSSPTPVRRPCILLSTSWQQYFNKTPTTVTRTTSSKTNHCYRMYHWTLRTTTRRASPSTSIPSQKSSQTAKTATFNSLESRMNHQVSVTCLPGLEGILRQEIDYLGLPRIQEQPPKQPPQKQQRQHKHGQLQSTTNRTRRGEVLLTSETNTTMTGVEAATTTKKGTAVQQLTPNDIYRACLYLGSATNIRIKCGPTFTARGLSELRRKTSLIEWSKILVDPILSTTTNTTTSSSKTTTTNETKLPPTRLHIRVTTSKSKLYHTSAIRDRVIQGILDAFGYTTNEEYEKYSMEFNTTSSVERIAVHNNKNNDDDSSRTNNQNNAQGPTISTTTNETSTMKRSNNRCGPVVRLDVVLQYDEVRIYVNASATPLHQRGYRLQTGKAPLREDLAYSILFAAGWVPTWCIQRRVVEEDNTTPRGTAITTTINTTNNNSKNSNEMDSTKSWTGLLDPFCGSGTIVIEGAAMAMGLPPGRFIKDHFLEGTVWKEQIATLHDDDDDDHRWMGTTTSTTPPVDPMKKMVRIAASDRDAGAVLATRGNAKRAGVLEMLTIEKCSYSSQPWLDDPKTAPTSFILVTNPPFGKRISPSSSSSIRKNMKNKKDGKNAIAKATPKDDDGGGDDDVDDGSSYHLLPLYQKLGHRLIQLKQKWDRAVGAVILTDNPSLLKRLGLSLSLKILFQSTHGGLPVSAIRLDIPPLAAVVQQSNKSKIDKERR